MAYPNDNSKNVNASISIQREGDTVSVAVTATVTRTISYEETSKVVSGILADIKRAITCYQKETE